SFPLEAYRSIVRILIDARCLQSPSPRSGVGVYAERIIRELIDGNQESRIRNSGIEWIVFANGFVNPRPHLPRFDAPNVRWTIGRIPNTLWNLKTMFQIPDSRFQIPDVVFLPNLNFLPPLPTHTRLIVTVHDLSFEHFTDCFTWKQRVWHRMIRPRALLTRADTIIAMSETTQRDLVETYGIPEKKIRVVYPGIEGSGVSTQLQGVLRQRYQLPAQFILTLSAIEPRKNIDGLIAAFELLPTTISPLHGLHLVIAGIPGSASRAIHRQIARSPARDRIHLLGAIPEHEKRALLALASCFVYPSLWEGFGFPPLEAMAVGVPVVASTGGALPEVLGNAALLVDPLDPNAIADAITRIHTDATLHADLRARGHARAAQFRWDTTAHQVLDCIMMGLP
ncbi:MAG: glycosyltransferase family 1 protein, partial [bacterium]|nr:glycosyltransferase family 1 protein [bacterium]